MNWNIRGNAISLLCKSTSVLILGLTLLQAQNESVGLKIAPSIYSDQRRILTQMSPVECSHLFACPPDSNMSISRRSISITVKGGFKANENGYPGTNQSGFVGFGLRFAISDNWRLGTQYTYWSAKSKYQLLSETVSLNDYAILISLRKRFDDLIALEIFCGPGIAFAGRTRSPNQYLPTVESSGLLTFNVALEGQMSLTRTIRIMAEIRKETAAEFDPGGGDSYYPWLYGLGIEFDL